MIGQHLYMRCRTKFFSRDDNRTADSTTVAMSTNVFPGMEQTRKAAGFLENYSGLEDARPVLNLNQDSYPGILKVVQIGKNVTMVGRSYRVQDMVDDGRDSTYSCNYILTGDEQLKFYEKPEYSLKRENFEPYMSVVNRIRNSRDGRIGVNEAYNLFQGQAADVDWGIFEECGFTEETFSAYISSIIQRVAFAKQRGVQNAGKVLVVFPREYCPFWNRDGGSLYGEKLLAATLKLLPVEVSSNLNAISCGGAVLEHNMLAPYQLVFLEVGPSNAMLKSEYSVIDLSQGKTHNVSQNTEYGSWMWKNIGNEAVRNQFIQQVRVLYGEEKFKNAVVTPVLMDSVVEIHKAQTENFRNRELRNNVLVGMFNSFCNTWNELSVGIVKRALAIENADHDCNKDLVTEMIKCLNEKKYTQELYVPIMTYLIHCVAKGLQVDGLAKVICKEIQSGKEEAIRLSEQFVMALQENGIVPDAVVVGLVQAICQDHAISPDLPLKQKASELFSDWYNVFLQTSQWNRCIDVLRIQAELLSDDRTLDATRKMIYGDAIYLMFYGDADSIKSASEILRKEEDRIARKNKGEYGIIWQCLKEQLHGEEYTLNGAIVSQFMYAIEGLSNQLVDQEWAVEYKTLAERFAQSQQEMVVKMPMTHLQNLIRRGGNEVDFYQKILCFVMRVILAKGLLGYSPYIKELMPVLKDLEGTYVNYQARILYLGYLGKRTEEHKKKYISEFDSFSPVFFWELALCSILQEKEDAWMMQLIRSKYRQRSELLRAANRWKWNSEEEMSRFIECYFSLVKMAFGNDEQRLPLDQLCKIYHQEADMICKVGNAGSPSEFIQNILNHTLMQFIRTLDMKDSDELTLLDNDSLNFIYQVKHTDSLIGKVSWDSRWNGVDVLYKLRNVKSMNGEDGFEGFYRTILYEKNKEQYIQPIENQIVYYQNLLASNTLAGRDLREIKLLVSAYAMLRMILMTNGRRGYDIDYVAESLKGRRGVDDRDRIIACYNLFPVLGNYSLPQYDDVMNAVANELNKYIRRNPGIFCDKELVNIYVNLPKHSSALKDQFEYELLILPKEWIKMYGIEDRRTVSGNNAGLHSVIAASLAFVLILAVSLTVFLVGAKNVMLVMIVSAVYALVGVSAVVAVFFMTLNDKRRSSGGRRQR